MKGMSTNKYKQLFRGLFDIQNLFKDGRTSKECWTKLEKFEKNLISFSQFFLLLLP